MRIKKARIRNYRSILDSGDINFDDKITALIGKNEQGKTSLLKSLETINKEYRYGRNDLHRSLNFDIYDGNDPIIDITFSLNEEDKDYFKTNNINIDNYNTLAVKKFLNNSYDTLLIDPQSSNEISLYDNSCFENTGEMVYNEVKKFFVQNIKILGRNKEEEIISYIQTLESNSGGFKLSPNYRQSLSATYYAIETLGILHSLDRINKDQSFKYILSNEKENGGFSARSSQIPNMRSTFHAIMCIKDLEYLRIINKDIHIRFVLFLQDNNGGFFNKESEKSMNGETRLESTYFAIRILKALDGLTEENVSRIIKYILSLEKNDGGFECPSGYVSPSKKIKSTCYAVSILNELTSLDKIDLYKHSQYLESFINSSLSQDTLLIARALKIMSGPNNKSIELLSNKMNMSHIPIDYKDKMEKLDAIFQCISIISIFESSLEEQAKTKAKQIICESNTSADDLYAQLNDLYLYFKAGFFVEGDFSSILSQSIKNKKTFLENSILNLLPTLFYSGGLLDFLPDSVTLDEYASDKEEHKTITNLLTLSGLNIDQLREMDHFIRRRTTKSASLKFTNMLVESWKQADELKLKIFIDGNQLCFIVEDETKIEIPPTERSDGFQWFLAFYINYMAGIHRDLKNSILLLDNPGLQLHPSAQKNLLSTLEILSSKCQIIYTTHSPYLIDAEHLDQIRIVEKDPSKGTIIKEKYYSSSLDSIKPIRDSLGFNLRDSLFISSENIFVEGISDKYILEGMLIYMRESLGYDSYNFFINSAGGVNKIPYYAYILSSESLRLAVVLDNDDQGSAAENELRKNNRLNDIQIIKLDKIKKCKNITIEDLINKDFYHLMVKKVYEPMMSDRLDFSKIEINGNSESRIIDTYNRLFHENNLGTFDKIKVALQLKKYLEEKPEKSEVGDDTNANFKTMFDLIKRGLDFKY